MAQAASHTEVNPMQLIQDLWAARSTHVLVAGVELNVFDHIAAGQQTAKEIARAAKANARGMEHLLDSLTAIGYLSKKGDKYSLLPVADRFLVSSRESYLGGFAYESKMSLPGWMQLADVVKTGKPVTAVDSEQTAREFFPKLVEAIFPMSYNGARAAVAAIPEKTKKRIKRILDVAAGSAAWSIPFAQSIPGARVTVVDFPEVTTVARRYTEALGVADRYDYIEGNIREVDFGRGQFDLVILGHIIHSEGEKWGRKLIKKSHRAISDNGMLLIAEMVPNDARTGPPLPTLFGLNMLIHTEEGDVFTMRQYREWLKSAGFKKVTQLDVPAPSPLILATK